MSKIINIESNSTEVKAIHRGIWVINPETNTKITCYVTNTKERVLSLRGTKDALGLVGGGSGALLRSLTANWIQPFLTDDLKDWIQKMEHKTIDPIKGLRHEDITPISADLFVDVLKAYINAQKSGLFKDERFKTQNIVADKAFLIMAAFAKVGLVSIIDEVTGYQKEREQNELQKLLSKYVAKELLPYTRRFPTEFYEEVYRLNGWGEFKDGKNKHPQTGIYTNYLIYDRLPQDVVEKLKEKVPQVEKNDRKYRIEKLHMGLTEDFGLKHLDTLIQQFIAIARGYDNFEEFNKHFKKFHKLPDDIKVHKGRKKKLS